MSNNKQTKKATLAALKIGNKHAVDKATAALRKQCAQEAEERAAATARCEAMALQERKEEALHIASLVASALKGTSKRCKIVESEDEEDSDEEEEDEEEEESESDREYTASFKKPMANGKKPDVEAVEQAVREMKWPQFKQVPSFYNLEDHDRKKVMEYLHSKGLSNKGKVLPPGGVAPHKQLWKPKKPIDLSQDSSDEEEEDGEPGSTATLPMDLTADDDEATEAACKAAEAAHAKKVAAAKISASHQMKTGQLTAQPRPK